MSVWKLIWLFSTVFAYDNLEGTDRLAPPDWKGNAWGPEATVARTEGRIPPVPMTPAMKQWDAWARRTLKDGDIVFRRGDAKILRGYFPMSRFLSNVSGSAFSHTGIVAIENGEPVVYDTTSLSVRRQPLYIWVLDNVGPIGVKRVRPEFSSYVPKAVEFCREQFRKQPGFDYKLGTDDSEFYCVEMTEKAYRNNGLPLAPPVKLGDMENISEFPVCVFGFLTFTELTLEQPVFFPGNERHGIWSSPNLVTVYAPPEGVTARFKRRWSDETPVAPGSTGVPTSALTPPPAPDQRTAGAAAAPTQR